MISFRIYYVKSKIMWSNWFWNVIWRDNRPKTIRWCSKKTLTRWMICCMRMQVDKERTINTIFVAYCDCSGQYLDGGLIVLFFTAGDLFLYVFVYFHLIQLTLSRSKSVRRHHENRMPVIQVNGRKWSVRVVAIWAHWSVSYADGKGITNSIAFCMMPWPPNRSQ